MGKFGIKVNTSYRQVNKSEEKKQMHDEPILKDIKISAPESVRMGLANTGIRYLDKLNEKEPADKDLREFLCNVYIMCINKNIDSSIAAGMIILEIKKCFFGCIKDHVNNDIETLKYMDNILFDKIEYVLKLVIEQSMYQMYSKRDKHENLRKLISTMIKNTAELIDYSTGFNYDKINEEIDEVFYVFLV